MNKPDYKNEILRCIHEAIKDDTLVLNVMGAINPHKFIRIEYENALNELMDSGEIVEISYWLPNRDAKSIFFPKNTIIESEQ